MISRRMILDSLLMLFLMPVMAQAELQVGAAVIDVTPDQLPVLVNGGMLSRSADGVTSRVHARALALKDGDQQAALVVVDSCMIPKELLDEAKKFAADQTGIPADHILISATHAHSAPSSFGCLGTSADPNYVPFLRGRLVEAIVAAHDHLEPAEVGWGVADAAPYTALRRWVRRPDRIANDPFGNPTVRANMHAARNLDDVVGESGPEDPDLSLIAFRSKSGRPIAVLANFSMHYFGDSALSADYYGLFCEGLKQKIAPQSADGAPEFVGIMSHGCSGDIYRIDYARPDAPENRLKLDEYAAALVGLAMNAYERIEFTEQTPLAMREARLPLKYRVPNKQRLEWAQRIVEAMGEGVPKTTEEVYAREQVLLDEMQSTEVVVQALRIGEIGIASTPTETYALTGLKIKKQSPLKKTIVIELANGADGYIPPPEQHLLGGYNTWAARSAGLEVDAERQISQTALHLLEQVSGQPRHDATPRPGAASKVIQSLKPIAYWRLNEFAGPQALDSSGHGHDATFEPQVCYYLTGPHSQQFNDGGEVNRAPHFVDDRLLANIRNLRNDYTVSLWFWNGLPVDAREVTGWMFSRGRDHVADGHGDHLGLGGVGANQGRLIFQHGHDASPVAGSTEIKRWTWNHVVLVRDGEKVNVYLNGHSKPEISTTSSTKFPMPYSALFFGGRCDNASNWEGRLDEIAVFDRALTQEDIASLAVSSRQE